MTPTLIACVNGHELTLLTLIDNNGDPYLRNDADDNGIILAGEQRKVIEIISASRQPSTKYQNLEELLNSMKQEQWLAIFDKHQIDLDRFLRMDEADLTKLEIKVGPRKKMLQMIHRLQPSSSSATSTMPSMELQRCREQLKVAEQRLNATRRELYTHQTVVAIVHEAGAECRINAMQLNAQLNTQLNAHLPIDQRVHLQQYITAIIDCCDRIGRAVVPAGLNNGQTRFP